MTDNERVWLVDRAYSDDEQNLIILTYATPDGNYEYRKERALTGFNMDRETYASLRVDPGNLAETVSDRQQEFEIQAQQMRENYDPGDVVSR